MAADGSSRSKINNRHSSIVNRFISDSDEDLLGHEDITMTEIYLHVAIGENGLGVESPLDELVGEVGWPSNHYNSLSASICVHLRLNFSFFDE